MTVLDKKQLNKLWAKSTDLASPQRDKHLYELAVFLWTSKQAEEAIAVAGTALEVIGERVGTTLWIEVMHLQSMALLDAKRPEEAIPVELEALKYGDTLQPANERAFMHLHLANCYRATEQKNLEEAEYEKAIEAFAEAENKFFLSQVYIDLSTLQYRGRRYLEAKKNLQLVVPILEEIQSTDRMTFVKYRMSGIERQLGNPLAALALAEDAVRLAKFSNEKVAECENTIELAIVHEVLGNYEVALDLLGSLIQDNDEQQKNRSAAKAIYYRARILKTLGQSDEAILGFITAIPILKIVGLEDLAINAELELIHSQTKVQSSND